MQEPDRKVVWALVFVLAVIAGILFLHFFVPVHYSGAQQPQNESDEWIWKWLTSAAFWTAIFTGVLTWSTVRLWKETRRLAEGAESQAVDNKASIEAARKTADAAVRTADAAIGAEVARIRPVQISLGMPLGGLGLGTGLANEPTIEDRIKCGELMIKFRNSGRTDGDLIAVSVNRFLRTKAPYGAKIWTASPLLSGNKNPTEPR